MHLAEIIWDLTMHRHTRLYFILSSYLSGCLADRWGTTVDFTTRAGIHEGPSRYRDHKANRPNSYGLLTCSEDAVFMKAGAGFMKGLQDIGTTKSIGPIAMGR